MKHLPIFILVSTLLLIGCGAGIVSVASGAAITEPMDETHIHGISSNENSALQIAVTETSMTAYTKITWYVWLPEDPVGNIRHSCSVNNSTVISSHYVTSAGFYEFEEIYIVGNNMITWSIGDEDYIFNLRITDRQIVESEPVPDNMIRVDPNYISTIEREVAVGCIIAALASSFLIIPYWKAKKAEGYEDAFDE